MDSIRREAARIVLETGLTLTKVVTVHRGARDNYQVALALSEAGMLEALVTDLYWPADRGWTQVVERMAPSFLRDALRCRHAESLPSDRVVSCWGRGLYAAAVEKGRWISFDYRREEIRRCDLELGHVAGRIATHQDAALLSYSYYGYSAFSTYAGGQPRILFQLHPHPGRVREILRRERLLHPQCASSLDKEWELALPEHDFDRLVEESAMPDHWLVASSFTKRTLTESGLPGARMHVIPYGIDIERFTPRRHERTRKGPMQLLFVGRLSQRKGLTYLLEAVDLLPPGSVELTVCGYAFADMDIFRRCRTPIRVRPSVSSEELAQTYGSSDVFVLPSLAEGFGHVLLEAMASGLPVISTTHTGAPDLIQDGEEGYITEPGNSEQLAASIEYFLKYPERTGVMGAAARRRAEQFTWQLFRQNVSAVVAGILQSSTDRTTAQPCLSF